MSPLLRFFVKLLPLAFMVSSLKRTFCPGLCGALAGEAEARLKPVSGGSNSTVDPCDIQIGKGRPQMTRAGLGSSAGGTCGRGNVRRGGSASRSYQPLWASKQSFPSKRSADHIGKIAPSPKSFQSLGVQTCAHAIQAIGLDAAKYFSAARGKHCQKVLHPQKWAVMLSDLPWADVQPYQGTYLELGQPALLNANNRTHAVARSDGTFEKE